MICRSTPIAATLLAGVLGAAPSPAGTTPVEPKPAADAAGPTARSELSPWERVGAFLIRPDSLTCQLEWPTEPYPIVADTEEGAVFARAILRVWTGKGYEMDMEQFEAGLSTMFGTEGKPPPAAAVIALTVHGSDYATEVLERVKGNHAGQEDYEFYQSGRTIVFYFHDLALEAGCVEEIRGRLKTFLPAVR